MADQKKVVYDLSNGIIFNYLERPYPELQGHAILWRWISQERYDITDIVSMKYYGLTHVLLNSVISNDLEWPWVT